MGYSFCCPWNPEKIKSPKPIDNNRKSRYNNPVKLSFPKGDNTMKRIRTLATRNLVKSVKNGGCGECQTSCQSACKTSCGVANQKCENKNK